MFLFSLCKPKWEKVDSKTTVPKAKTVRWTVFRLTIKCQEKNKNICEFCKLRNWYDKKSNRLVAQKQVFRGNKIIVCMILLLFLNGK